HGIDGVSPTIRFRNGDQRGEIACEFVAGCDGFHGVCRSAIPQSALSEFTRVYPFGWFGILTQAPPSSRELIYAHHSRGFALVSTRSPDLQRLYFQCDPHDDMANWPDERIWAEFRARLGTHERLAARGGPVTQT